MSFADKKIINCLATISALKYKALHLDETPDIPIVIFNFQPRSQSANENGVCQSYNLKCV
jgi:hypothetical protein